MRQAESFQYPPGFYRIYWKSGGSSLAAVGVLPNGKRWLAPINWVHPTEDQRYWRLVDKLVPVYHIL